MLKVVSVVLLLAASTHAHAVSPIPITLTAPANGSSYPAPATISLTARAVSVTDGYSVTSVTFLSNGVPIHTDASAPYSFSWTSVPAGSYNLQARVQDNTGDSRISSAATVTVSPAANQAPIVSLTAPAGGSTYVATAAIVLSASASDNDGSISKVEFFKGSTLIGTATSAPYALTWNEGSPGIYAVTAKAWDNVNAATVSAARTVTVNANSLPSVSITAPAHNASYLTPASIVLTATASDSDGTIDRVEFRAGGVLIGTDTAAPYTATWTAGNIGGTYAVGATAFDNKGGSGTSSVNVVLTSSSGSVSAAPNPCPFYESWQTVCPMTITWSSNNAAAKLWHSYLEAVGGDLIAREDVIAVGGSGSTPIQVNFSNQMNRFKVKSDDVVVATMTPQHQWAPNLSITSPADSQIFQAPASITINATASDSDGSVTKVEFYSGTTLLATDTTSPYQHVWSDVAAGAKTVVVKAYDNLGAMDDTLVPITVNAQPTVSLTAPAEGASYAAGATITITASAADADDPISSVEFYNGTTLLGTDTVAPYSYAWSGAAGSATAYPLSAKVYDSRGGTGTSASRSIIVNANPTVSLARSPPTSMLAAPASFALGASAADSDGSISKVEFYMGTTLLGTDTSAPYSHVVADLGHGSYSFSAKAYDNRGAITTSAANALTVNALPTVTLTAPADGATYVAPATITLTASAADADDPISRVEFYSGATLLGTDSTAPYSHNWSGVAGSAASYSLSAKVYDSRDGTGTSASRSITINAEPTISLSRSPSAAVVAAPANITLSVVAADSDGTVSKVEFHRDGQLLATDTSAPHSHVVTTLGSGNYNFTATAYDDRGAATTSVTNALTVNALPTVSLTAPADGTVVDAPGQITVSATAASSDGSISRVEFYQGTVLLGQDTSSPYSVSWANVAAGTYVVSAKAIDSRGGAAISAPATVLVRAPSVPTPLLTRRYVYDMHERLCKVIEPETGATVMGYDEAGNLIWSAAGLPLLDPGNASCDADRSTAFASGRRVDRSYDSRNRVETLVFPDGNGNQVWGYTNDGLPAQIATSNSGGTATNVYNYNRRRLLTGESLSQEGRSPWSVGYGYNENGHLASHVYPDQLAISYVPNALGQSTQAGPYAAGVSYYPNGALKQFTYGNGIIHNLEQNDRGLPARSHDASSAAFVLDDSYDYDPNGNVAAIRDGLAGHRGNRNMTYDQLDRLLTAQSPMFGTDPLVVYEYDRLDNLQRVKANGVDHTYVYNASNQLTNVTNTIGGASVVGLDYDVQGNLRKKNGAVHSFDYGNRLRMVLGKEEYGYDGNGRRIRAAHLIKGDIWSHYGQDGALRFQEDQRRGKFLSYIYLGGSLVAQREALTFGGTATVTYQHTDALGSPVATTDAGGNLIERIEYAPYGQRLNGPVKDGPGYTGHVMDAATGLAYMQQRYYDPSIGRFLSVDPVTADGNTGVNFNRYWYANNNPYRFTDPDGRVSREDAKDRKDWRSIEAKSPGSAAQMTTSARASGSEVSGGSQAQRTQQALEVAGSAMVSALMTIPDAMSPDGGGGISTLGALFGIKSSSAEFGGLIGAANKPFNASGLSVAARAWEKHAGRPGGSFPALTGNISQKNLAAENFVRSAVGGARTDLSRGGFEYRTSTGQGVRFDQDGSFSTLLDPKR